MNPRLKNSLIMMAAALVAVLLGINLANEEYSWLGFSLAICTAAILTRALSLSGDVIVVGMVTFGYLVGNRGFAQLTPAASLPLLPAEGALLVASSWALISAALEKKLPYQRNALNWAVAIWLVVGTVHAPFDTQRYGLLALRDFAMTYYAVFFFLAQRVGAIPKARNYLLACILAGFALLTPLSICYELWPNLFFQLRVRGIPLLLYKGDLVLMFTACAGVMFFLTPSKRGWHWLALYAMLLCSYVLMRESRASIVGLLLVIGLLALHRHWRMPVAFLSTVSCGAAVILALAALTSNRWAEERLTAVGRHFDSIVNPVRNISSAGDDTTYKWDNNRFRLVWWRTLSEETLQQNPVLGLGFGYDMAKGFVQAYNPEMSDDFSARSPHNIALTALGRLGLVGLASWLFVTGCILKQAWLSFQRDKNPQHWSVWGSLLIILVTAHLQVVLEGPMGAVPFWVLLGLASATMRAPASDQIPDHGEQS